MSRKVLLAVNGTLMRGLKLNPNMAAAKATFVRDAATRARRSMTKCPTAPRSSWAPENTPG